MLFSLLLSVIYYITMLGYGCYEYTSGCRDLYPVPHIAICILLSVNQVSVMFSLLCDLSLWPATDVMNTHLDAGI